MKAIRVQFNNTAAESFKSSIDLYLTKDMLDTIKRVDEITFDIYSAGQERFSKYSVIDFLDSLDIARSDYQIIDEFMDTPKSVSNVWCPISAGFSKEWQKKQEAIFGSNWRDLYNGL